MSGVITFGELFPVTESPNNSFRLFGYNTFESKNEAITVQQIISLLELIDPDWSQIQNKPSTFAPSAHSLGSHSNVASGIDSAADGTFVKKVGGQFQAVTVDFYGASNPPPPDPSIDDAVRLITGTKTAQWDQAYGWGNHSGQYRPISYVPSWAEITSKPPTFSPSAHTLGSHSDAAALATATEGQLVRKAAIGFEAFTADYYSPFNPPPPDASVPDFVRDFTIGQFAGYEAKMLEFTGLPDGAVPLVKNGVPADSELKGIYTENPFDPETEEEDYNEFVEELLYLISTKRIKGVAGVDSDDYVVKSQLDAAGGGPTNHNDLTNIQGGNSTERYHLSLNQWEGIPTNSDAPTSLNKFVTVSALNSYAYVQEAPINGNHYARKDGVWVAFTPFVVAGTATDGHVVTSVSGVPTWAAPSGGGGSSAAIVYDAAQSLSGIQRQQALGNIGSSAGEFENFDNTGLVTLNNLVISKSNIEFSGASTVTLNGIVPLWDGQEITIQNRTGNPITFTEESASSASSNRFFGRRIISAFQSIRLKYVSIDALNKRWIAVSSPFAASGYFSTGLRINGGVGINKEGDATVGLSIVNPTLGGYAFWIRNNADNADLFRVEETGTNITRLGVNRAHSATAGVIIRNPTSGGYALWIRNNADNADLVISKDNGLEVTNRMTVGGTVIHNDHAINSRAPNTTYGMAYVWLNKAGSYMGSVNGDGDITSSKGFYFGASIWYNPMPANHRAIIRGIGTGNNTNLLLEGSGGLQQFRVLDNGRIFAYNLPTTAPTSGTKEFYVDGSGFVKLA